MQKVILIDNLYSDDMMASHNKKYADALLTIPETVLHKDYKIFIHNSKTHYIKGYFERCNYIKKISREYSTWHFLVLDYLYRFPMIFMKIKKSNIKIIATLHNIPKTKNTWMLLKLTSKYIDKIVVHSDYLKSQLNLFGINNAWTIDYPAFIDKDQKLDKMEFLGDKCKFLCLGATRWNKGADLAICAASRLSDVDKKKACFIFAGIEEDIKYADIEKTAQSNNVNIHIDNRLLPENDYWNYVYSSDIILIPYRRGFSGASGPLTDGAFMGKIITGPSNGNLGHTIMHNQLGPTFEAENIDEMVSTMHELIANGFIISEISRRYRTNLGEKEFVQKYADLYQNT